MGYEMDRKSAKWIQYIPNEYHAAEVYVAYSNLLWLCTCNPLFRPLSDTYVILPPVCKKGHKHGYGSDRTYLNWNEKFGNTWQPNLDFVQ